MSLRTIAVSDMEFIFRKLPNGKIAVHDSFVDAESPTGFLIEVESDETGEGYIIDGDPTEHFYRTPEEAAEFLRGYRLRLPANSN